MTSLSFGVNDPKRDELLNVFRNIANNKNNWENLRVNPNLMQPEDYIEYARLAK